ncbi:PTS system mannose/fructose/sorbose family transporter subunit IID [Allofustis seminis]|uniref:PTS system mannose/fructose/sorbose family transporter subunit IID n=1 Tax=Allofustis seminis TaxID=166939 RepID=UPI00037856A1|nr:PTS system mannose/fructose/sorbose family transporter subunit IID [Allofustis seminis]
MPDNKKTLLTKKDVTNTYIRWWWTAEVSNSFERMQALAYGASIAPIIDKLYKDNEDERIKGLKRHLAFFNTQAIWGALIMGTTVAMEEQRAAGEKIPEEMITSIKTGLMGPLAGVGDSLDFGTVMTIFDSLAASFATAGNFLGAALIVLFNALHFMLGYFFMHLGYREGKKSIVEVLESGRINTIIQTAGMLGMFMMGALSANMVRLSTPLEFDFAGSVINVQSTLDSIVPGLLPLGAVLSVYWAMKYKKISLSKLMIILTVIALVGSFFKVF